MNEEKTDAILNLSMDTDEAVRRWSEVLGTGVNEIANTWEVIAKYHGDILTLAGITESIEILLNGYAIITVTREQLDELLQQEQIDYVEMPKSMQYGVYRAKQASCILPLTGGNLQLTGKGVLVAVIDSGIDYLLSDFQNENGSRILYLWDQSNETGEAPEGFTKGSEYNKDRIDEAIAESEDESGQRNYGNAYAVVPSRDITGHGTAVAGIAAGSAVSLLYQGVAPESELIIVKLNGNGQNRTEVGIGTQEGKNDQNFPLTTDLMRGITYVVGKALELNRPVVINISIGDTYGAHDGNSLLEQFINDACEIGRNVICIGSGNEAVTAGHTSFVLEEGREQRIELAIADRERNCNVQLWKNFADTCRILLEAPNGERFVIDSSIQGRLNWEIGNTRVLIYVGVPGPYIVNQEIFFDFVPMTEYADGGIWTFIITPIGRSQQDYHMFLPNSNIRNRNTGFLTPTPDLTMTIPAFAFRALTVGAYDVVTNNYADFSGRDRETGIEENQFFATVIKPDLTAPGVGITAPVPGGGYASFTGTSFAAPIVTGSSALLMEWGIVRGKDPFLYGEKVKAYLRKGAKELRVTGQYPNNRTGWGKLCVEESLPGKM